MRKNNPSSFLSLFHFFNLNFEIDSNKCHLFFQLYSYLACVFHLRWSWPRKMTLVGISFSSEYFIFRNLASFEISILFGGWTKMNRRMKRTWIIFLYKYIYIFREIQIFLQSCINKHAGSAWGMAQCGRIW